MSARTEKKAASKSTPKPSVSVDGVSMLRAKTRALIIHSAIPVFAEFGPDAPTIDDFVKVAGVSRGTFYNYFRTTHELLDAALVTLSDEFVAAIFPTVADEPNPVIRLARATWLYYHRVRANPQAAAFLDSVRGFGVLADIHVRRDIEKAAELGLIGIKDIDLAVATAMGIMAFALRLPRRRRGEDERGLEMVRATLAALGVAPALITKALKESSSQIKKGR
jgi:AcrR family transcriptional regulator